MGNEYTGPERRENWNKCGHHSQLEEQIKDARIAQSAIKAEMRTGFAAINRELEAVKISNAADNQRIVTLFNLTQEVKSWIKGLVFLVVGQLLAFFIWFIQGLGGG